MKIFFYMILMHIIDDFVLQPISLSKLKQKEFWEKNYPDKLYEHDYITALIIHGFSWSIMVHLPIFAFSTKSEFLISLSVSVNAFIHALIDDLKANDKKINLGTDQKIHLLQVFIIFILFCIL